MDKQKLKQLAESVKKNGIETGGEIILPDDLGFVVQKGIDGQADRYSQVAITGWSGGGKTTTAEFLARVFELIAFEGDNITFHAFADPSYREITKRIFNLKDLNSLPEHKDVLEFVYKNYLPITFEKDHDLFAETRSYVVKQLKKAYSDPTMDFKSHPIFGDAVLYHPKENGIIKPNGFVMEMCGFHKADILKRKGNIDRSKLQTDFLACIINEPEQRKKMLRGRSNNQDFVKAGEMDKVIEIREAVQKKLLTGVRPDLYAYNLYDDASLVQSVEHIIQMMIGKGVVKRKEETGKECPVGVR